MNDPKRPPPTMRPTMPTPRSKELPPLGDPVLVAIRRLEVKVDACNAATNRVAEEMGAVVTRLDAHDEKLDGFEGRILRNSSQVKQPSQHDLAAQAELAKERIAREALAAKLALVESKTDEQTQILSAIHETVAGVIHNKKVVFVGRLLFAAAMAYAAAHGLKVLP